MVSTSGHKKAKEERKVALQVHIRPGVKTRLDNALARAERKGILITRSEWIELAIWQRLDWEEARGARVKSGEIPAGTEEADLGSS